MGEKSSFITLTNPLSGSHIAVRGDKVVFLEEAGDGSVLVNMENGESFMCKESIVEITGMIRDAMIIF